MVYRVTVTLQSTWCIGSQSLLQSTCYAGLQSLYSPHITWSHSHSTLSIPRSTVQCLLILTLGVTYNYQCTEVPSAKLLVPSSFSEASVLRFLAPVKIVSLAGRCHGEVICLRKEEGAQPTMSRQIDCMLIYGVEVQGPEGLSFEAAWILYVPPG